MVDTLALPAMAALDRRRRTPWAHPGSLLALRGPGRCRFEHVPLIVQSSFPALPMDPITPTADDFLTIGPKVRVLPIIHGSGDFAIRVREELLNRPYDCLAVPLPPSFQDDVEACIDRLPTVSVVAQLDVDRGEDDQAFSYVPIDPCQGVIAALRTALGERIAREFIDMETPRFEAIGGVFPDPYALKRVSPERFAAALLPAIAPPRPGQNTERIAWMAGRLRQLESR